MAWPLHIEAGLRDAPLPTSRPVSVRVLHFALTLSLGFGGGIWGWNLPVLAIDHATNPPRRHLILDPGLAVVALALLMLVVSSAHVRRNSLSLAKGEG